MTVDNPLKTPVSGDLGKVRSFLENKNCCLKKAGESYYGGDKIIF